MTLNCEIFSVFVFIIKSKNKFQIRISIFNKNWKMNFVVCFLRDFFFAESFSDQLIHLSFPWKKESFHEFSIFWNIENKSRISNQILIKSNFIQILKFKCNFWISFFFLTVKFNFQICIKIISKNDIFFRPRLLFSTNCWKGLSKEFWIEKVIVSCFYFFDSFIQQQWIRCTQKKCVTFSLRKQLMKK